jgi:23S rRNA (guanine745-N1)-methyltransferase
VASIFAPRPLEEIRRVLRPGGHALFVFPEAGHWQELRAFVPLAQIGEDKLPAGGLDGFTSVLTQPVRAPRELAHAELVDLVAMSPSIHRLEREGGAWQKQLPEKLTATLSVQVALFRRKV